MLKTLAKGWKSMGSASMTLVLLLVCIGLSLATIDRVEPTGTAAGEWLARSGRHHVQLEPARDIDIGDGIAREKE